eukprot:2660656-Rhodomonas_salina.1
MPADLCNVTKLPLVPRAPRSLSHIRTPPAGTCYPSLPRPLAPSLALFTHTLDTLVSKITSPVLGPSLVQVLTAVLPAGEPGSESTKVPVKDAPMHPIDVVS